MERSFTERLHALGTELRIDARSNIHMYVQLNTDTSDTPIWILQAINDTGRCQMHILESWLCVWMAPDIGLFGSTTHEQWNKSPLVLPDEFFDRTKVNVAANTIDLSDTPLQALVRAFWHVASMASSASSSIPPLMDVMVESMERFAKILPLPRPSHDGMMPNLQLRRVQVNPGHAFFYDCWHVIAPARAVSVGYKTCPAGSPLAECMSDACFVMAHENQFSVDDRSEYVSTVLSSLNLDGNASELKACLSGIDVSARRTVLAAEDHEHFISHGILWIAWNDETKTFSSSSSSSSSSSDAPSSSSRSPSIAAISCPCRDIATWLLHYCASSFAIDVFAQLYRRMDGDHSLTTMSMVLVVPIDLCDERLQLVTPGTRMTCYLPHQPRQDIVLPHNLTSNTFDYSTYRPRAADNDKQIIQTFKVLSVDTETRLIHQMYHGDKAANEAHPKRRRAK